MVEDEAHLGTGLNQFQRDRQLPRQIDHVEDETARAHPSNIRPEGRTLRYLVTHLVQNAPVSDHAEIPALVEPGFKTRVFLGPARSDDAEDPAGGITRQRRHMPRLGAPVAGHVDLHEDRSRNAGAFGQGVVFAQPELPPGQRRGRFGPGVVQPVGKDQMLVRVDQWQHQRAPIPGRR